MSREYRQMPRGPSPDANGEFADNLSRTSHDVLHALTEDHDRIARDLNDTLVRQIFMVSLDLHAALARLDHQIDHLYAAAKIRHAIGELDRAIKLVQSTVAGLSPAQNGARLSPAQNGSAQRDFAVPLPPAAVPSARSD